MSGRSNEMITLLVLLPFAGIVVTTKLTVPEAVLAITVEGRKEARGCRLVA